MTFHRLRLIAAAAALAGGVPVHAQEFAAAAEALDCLIEPFRVVDVGSPAVGVLEEVRVERGDRVAAGQVLAMLQSGVEAATVEVARLRAAMDSEVRVRQVTQEYRRSTHERTERLVATQAVAQQTRDEAAHDARVSALRVLQAEEERRLARAELARAEQALALRTIRSPVDGVVMERKMSPGERVEQQPIVRIAQLHPLQVQVVLPVERYGSVVPGMRASVTPEHGPARDFEARVTAVDPVLDAASGTFGVRMALPNPDYALPGGLRCTLAFLPGRAEPVAGGTMAAPVPPQSDQEAVPDTRPKKMIEPSQPDPVPVIEARRTSPVTVAAAHSTTADRSCVTLGPIEHQQQASRLRKALSGQDLDGRIRPQDDQQVVGYLVTVKGSEVDGGTEAVLTRLQREGLADYAELPASPGTVSVGYFRGPQSASARAARIQAIGLPARITPRTRGETRYYVDLDLPAGGAPALLDPVLAAQGLQALGRNSCAGMVTASR